ncbi:MAG TPA: SRPBCC domain-containing protein [Anaerolineaceae bacterium]
MTETLRLSTTLPAAPEQVYWAWLSSEEHGLFTGSPAEVDPRVEGRFTAWDGYIQGKTLALEPYGRILQSWRTTDFPAESPDSLLEVLIRPDEQGAVVELIHTEIPDGQGEEYRQGWEEYYLAPMREYFAGKS